MADEHHAKDNAHPRLEVLAGGAAVITGGASGIGFALAEKAIAHGLHPVLADIDAPAIAAAEAELADAAQAAGVEVYGHRVDVSSAEDVQALADAVAARFPDRGVSLLCCNAGVGGGGSVIGARDLDWDFVLGVNVKGVANCVRAFVPGMVAGDRAGTVVATSSQDGLCAAQGVYGVSKHACVALTEALFQELRGRLSVHVLCPNVVATNIVLSGRHRPERFGGPVPAATRSPQRGSARGHPSQEKSPTSRIAERFKAYGMPPARCASAVFDAIESGIFYVLAEAEEDPGYVYLEAETRMKAILDGGLPRRPVSKWISSIFNPTGPPPSASGQR